MKQLDYMQLKNTKKRFEEFGIYIGKSYQGNGYGSEILELILDLCLNKLNGKDFEYWDFIENEKSKMNIKKTIE